MMIRSLQQHARRVLSHISNARLFCSNTNATLSTSNQTLQNQIESALHQNAKISTVLKQWRQQGNKLSPSIVRGILEKLRDSKQYPQALDVSQWMTEHKICSLVPEDYTTRFHLTENVLGFKEAEKFLEKVPENLRNESMYTALLKSYAESGGKNDVDRAEAVFKKMRELETSLCTLRYSMTSLYISVGNRVKVDEVLREMNETNVKIDSLDMPEAENVSKAEAVFEKMGELGFLTKLSPFKWMISLYSVLGKRVEIEKLLRKMKEKNIELDSVTMNNALRVRNKTGEMGNEEYISVVKSLLKLGDVKGAQEMCGEWEQSSSGEEFDVQEAQEKSLAIYRYGEKGGEKIKMLMKNMVGVVLLVCYGIAVIMILLAAANDRYIAFSLAMLWLSVSTSL